METDFQESWERILLEAYKLDLYPTGSTLGKWVIFMQGRGYRARLNGDLLNKAIVDFIVRRNTVLN